MEHCPTHGGRLWIQPQSGKDRFDNQPLEDGRGDLGLARAAVRAALQVDVEYALAVVDQMRRRLTCAAQRRRRAPHAVRTALCGDAAALVGRAPRRLPRLFHPGPFDRAPGRVGGQKRD